MQLSLFFQPQPLDRQAYIHKLTWLVSFLCTAFILYYITLYTQTIARLDPTVFNYGLQIITTVLTFMSWMAIAFLSGDILLFRLQYLRRSEIWMLPICLLAIAYAPWGFLLVSVMLSFDQLQGPSLEEMLEQLNSKQSTTSR